MKNYLIECEHNIYVDNYEQGEGKNVNNFDTKGEYKAENPTQAIEKHLSSLGYSFEKDCMQPDEIKTGKHGILFCVMLKIPKLQKAKKILGEMTS